MSTVNRMTDSSGFMSSRYTFGFGAIATRKHQVPIGLVSDAVRLIRHRPRHRTRTQAHPPLPHHKTIVSIIVLLPGRF